MPLLPTIEEDAPLVLPLRAKAPTPDAEPESNPDEHPRLPVEMVNRIFTCLFESAEEAPDEAAHNVILKLASVSRSSYQHIRLLVHGKLKRAQNEITALCRRLQKQTKSCAITGCNSYLSVSAYSTHHRQEDAEEFQACNGCTKVFEELGKTIPLKLLRKRMQRLSEELAAMGGELE